VASSQVGAQPSRASFPISYDGNYYGWASSNWSGYAVTAGSYTATTGSWTVPNVAPSRRATYSASWIGIDGFNNSDLIQTGIEQDYYKGAARYTAWWTTNEEGFAEQAFSTTVTVSAGDVIQASISETGTNRWTITLEDVTTKVTGTQTGVAHTGLGASAEWIVEDPALSVNGARFHLAALADYGNSTFDRGTINGTFPGFIATSTDSDAGLMVQHAHVVSIPSAPDGDTTPDGFASAYGGTAPTAPTS
jgi:hypothetical protein